MVEVAPGSAPKGSRYCDQRPYAVAERLDDLHGPTTGKVIMDHRIDWSPRAVYDLDDPRRLATMYETVLREASNHEDLAQWLDWPTLVRLWPTLILPPQTRQPWEDRFPELAAARHPAA